LKIHGVPQSRNECPIETRSDRLNQHPPIIVRFANRDKRNELYSKRKMLQGELGELKFYFRKIPLSSIEDNVYDAKFTTHVFREVFAPAEPIFH